MKLIATLTLTFGISFHAFAAVDSELTYNDIEQNGKDVCEVSSTQGANVSMIVSPTFQKKQTDVTLTVAPGVFVELGLNARVAEPKEVLDNLRLAKALGQKVYFSLHLAGKCSEAQSLMPQRPGFEFKDLWTLNIK